MKRTLRRQLTSTIVLTVLIAVSFVSLFSSFIIHDHFKDYIEVKLSRLRKKITDCGIGAPAIQVIRGHGYKLCFNIVLLVA